MEKLRSIKDLYLYIKKAFDRETYQSYFLFKVVTVTITILLGMWLFSSIYFANKVYHFVTHKTSALQSKAHNEIQTKGEDLAHLGHTLLGYTNDEGKAYSEMGKEWDKKKRKREFETQEVNIKETIRLMSLYTVQDYIAETPYSEPINIDYVLGVCHGDIKQWLGKRSENIEVKLRVMKQYQDALDTKTNWETGEKRAKLEYIEKYKNINPDTSYATILAALKEKEAKDLVLETHIFSGHEASLGDIEKMKFCIAHAEDIINALYLYDYHYSNYDESFNIYPFQYLASIARDLNIGKELDFTVPDILIEEMAKIHQHVCVRCSRPWHEIKGWAYRNEIPILMAILEETNQKLAQVDPNNIGFKTNAYKLRMQEYELWKVRWDEIQAQANTTTLTNQKKRS